MIISYITGPENNKQKAFTDKVYPEEPIPRINEKFVMGLRKWRVVDIEYNRVEDSTICRVHLRELKR